MDDQVEPAPTGNGGTVPDPAAADQTVDLPSGEPAEGGARVETVPGDAGQPVGVDPNTDGAVTGGMSPRAQRSALIGAAAAAALILVALVVIALRGGGGTPAAVAPQPPKLGPTKIGTTDLRSQEVALGRPVYWAGPPSPKQKLELTIAADGGNTLRYVSGKRTDAASARAVAMYPMPEAYTTAEASAHLAGAMSQQVAGGLVVGNTANAYNGYLAVADLPFLIEVYDPVPGMAWKLLTTGRIVPISG
jgi:hypothetical protein